MLGLACPRRKSRRRRSARSNAIRQRRAPRSTKIAGKVVLPGFGHDRAGLRSDATILDAADDAGVFIDNACRSGTCGSCRVKLASGRVRWPVEDALTEQDKAEGYILACQAKISGDVAVDA